MNFDLPTGLPCRDGFFCNDPSALGRGVGYVLRGYTSTVSLVPIPSNHARPADVWRCSAHFCDDSMSEEMGRWILSDSDPDVRVAMAKVAQKIRNVGGEHDFEFMDVLDWKAEDSAEHALTPKTEGDES